MPRGVLLGSNASSGGGGAPSGAAGGELAGTYPNPTVKDGVIDDANIVSGGLTNAAIATAAAIAQSKVSGLTTALAAKAPLASPTFTGTVDMSGATVTLPSGLVLPASVDISTALSAVGDGTPAMDGTAARGTGTHAARNDHVHPTDTSRLAASATLDAITAPAADVSLNSHKITNLTNGSAAQDAAAFGQLPTAGSVGGFAKIIRRSSTSSTISSSAALASDDTLLWAVGASDVWFFEGFIMFVAADSSGAAATADAKIGWSVPTGGTMTWGILSSSQGLFGGYAVSNAGGTPIPMLGAGSTATLGMAAGTIGISVAGVYTGTGTAGNVNLQWSQSTSNAATLAIGINSIIRATRLA